MKMIYYVELKGGGKGIRRKIYTFIQDDNSMRLLALCVGMFFSQASGIHRQKVVSSVRADIIFALFFLFFLLLLATTLALSPRKGLLGA